MRNEVSPIHKMRREKIRYKRSKSFLRDFEAIMKIHVPLQLENKMKNLLDQMKLILALSKWQKNVLKMTTQKSKTLPFTKIFLTHASLCCDVMMARHIRQPRWRVYDSLLIKRMLKELLKVDVQHLDYCVIRSNSARLPSVRTLCGRLSGSLWRLLQLRMSTDLWKGWRTQRWAQTGES